MHGPPHQGGPPPPQFGGPPIHQGGPPPPRGPPGPQGPPHPPMQQGPPQGTLAQDQDGFRGLLRGSVSIIYNDYNWP